VCVCTRARAARVCVCVCMCVYTHTPTHLPGRLLTSTRFRWYRNYESRADVYKLSLLITTSPPCFGLRVNPIYVYINMHTHNTHKHIYIHTHAHTIYIYAYVYMYIYIYIYMHMYVCICMYVCMYAYIYIYIITVIFWWLRLPPVSPGGERGRWHAPLYRHLRALFSVCGRCSFGDLGCCSCRARVFRCRGCCSLSVSVCVCVCDLLIFFTRRRVRVNPAQQR